MSDTITIDGVIYSQDKKVLIKYPEEKQEETFHVPDFVEEIRIDCFKDNDNVKNIYIGENVKKIAPCGLCNYDFNIKKIYIPSSVEELDGEIFDMSGDDAGDFYFIEVVGGERGSKIEFYCNERGIPFVEFKASDVEKFYSLEVEELKALIEEQAKNVKELDLIVSENGYRIQLLNDILEVSKIANTVVENVAVQNLKSRLNSFHREKVKKIIIADEIDEICEFAFDDFNKLETVVISANVKKISSLSFTGKDKTDSWGCSKLSSFVVDENNKYYKSVDGVLYTFDMQTLVTYPPAKPELYYEIDSNVKNIGEYAFKGVNKLECLKVNDGCVSVGELAFLNIKSLRHVYFASSVVDWPEYFPFIEMIGYERPCRYGNLVIGGEKGSCAYTQCEKGVTYFHEVSEEDIANFLAVPYPGEEDDRYYQNCLKQMIVSKDGILEQVGEFGDELILPEGVKRTRYRINLSKCKRVVIPSTMESIWAEGFDGPAPELKEFVVSPKNEIYDAINGHLYFTPLNLMTYAPGAENYGVIPEGTRGVCKEAFRLLPKPFEKLSIPGSLKHIGSQYVRGGWFYEAEVSPDNIDYKAIDGSIYTIDGKELVYAKISENGFVVPEGTETIAKCALNDVYGSVTIPASVKEIKDVYGFGRKVKKMITPKGSYAEYHAIKYKRIFPIEIVYDGEVESCDYEAECEKKNKIDINFSGPNNFMF